MSIASTALYLGERKYLPERAFQVEGVRVEIYATRDRMGAAAARRVGQHLGQLRVAGGRVNVVFAAAPSQADFMGHLRGHPAVDWRRVRAFQLDEYVGLPATATQSFGYFLRAHLFDLVRPGEVQLFAADAADLAAECARYTALLAAHPLDLACIGMGENGHLGYNDPPDADFADPLTAKVVELADKSRRQAVRDGFFPKLEQTPTQALTLTIPAIMAAPSISCVVPGSAKAPAVRAALQGPIDAACPASVLRRHPQAVLYLDRDSASLL